MTGKPAREVAICLRKQTGAGSKVRNLFLTLNEAKVLRDLLAARITELE